MQATNNSVDLLQSLLWILPQCIGDINERGLDVKVCVLGQLNDPKVRQSGNFKVLCYTYRC